MIIAKNSYLDMGAFTVPLRKDSQCFTLHHFDLTTGATSRTPDTASPTIFDSNFEPETSSLFTLRLLLKLLPCLHPFQITSGIGDWVLTMGG